MAFIVNFAETNSKTVSRFEEFYQIDQARRCLNELFSNLSNHEKANEYQPTTFGKKDYFHFYVKMEDGTEEKRAFYITRLFKTEKYSLRTGVEQKERAKELGLNIDYFS